MNVGSILFSPSGRINRQEFWVAWLILFVAGIVAAFLPFIGVLVTLGMIYPLTCIYVKRFHDIGYSGWLRLIPYVAWLIAFVVCAVLIFSNASLIARLQDESAPQDPAQIMQMLAPMLASFIPLFIAMLVSLAMWLWAGIAPSQPGENRFGLPVGSNAVDAFN